MVSYNGLQVFLDMYIFVVYIAYYIKLKRSLLSIIFLISNSFLFAQPPQAINYQAVVRRSTGDLLSNQEIHFQISILQDSAGGTVVYQETHNTETNLYGLANLAIGTGTVLMGNFNEISWGSTGHYIRIELDTTDGSNFYEMGTIQLLSVPYALYAKEVSTVSPEDTTRWNTAYSWGNHALVGYLTDYTETDPVFGLSTASGILGSQILNWNTSYSWGDHSTAGYLKSENDPKVGSPGLNYLPKWNGSALVNSCIFETASGNIGIGTATPQEKLHVSGNMVADTAYANAFSSNSPLLLQTNGTTRIYVSDLTGHTGIGTQTPSERLEVQGKISSSSGLVSGVYAGITDTLNQISLLDLDNERLKYRTYIYSGGIITYTSPDSDWVDSVGDFILLPPFNCGDTVLDDRNGELYPTVQIGSQCWMAKNLFIGVMISHEMDQTDNDTIETWCYNDDLNNCLIYGGLYQWFEMMEYDTLEGVRGICPMGWHIPAPQEADTLSDYLGGYLQAGGKMKTTGTIENGDGLWYAPNYGATNESGFSLLPGGWFQSNNNLFALLGYESFTWTSSYYQSPFNLRIARMGYYGTKSWSYQQMIGTHGFSVRCIRDNQ